MEQATGSAHEAGVRILIGDDYSGLFGKIALDNPLQHQAGAYSLEPPLYAEMPRLDAAAVLSWATRNPGLLLARGRDRVGVVQEGAIADLIVVDGDPIADVSLLTRPAETFKAVILDGQFYLDRLSRANRRADKAEGTEAVA